jgi:hypothetical protein
MIKAFPGGWDAMAAALGMSRDALENRIYERKGQGLLGETERQMQKFSGTTFYAEAVATDSGGTFIKLPTDLSLDNEVLEAKFRALYVELGQFTKDFNDATADDLIDRREQVLLEADAARVHKILAELLALTFRVYTAQPRAEAA